MHWYWMALGILSVWRVTYLLHAEDGPWNVVAHFRRLLGKGFWGGLLDCFYCLSLWIAVPFGWLIGESLQERLLLILAFSGAAILLERATAEPQPYWKEE